MEMHRRDAALMQWTSKVLRQQDAVLKALQGPNVGRRERYAVARLIGNLRLLQRAIWNSLAGQRRQQLLQAARQVDALADQWSQLASQLGVAAAPAAPSPADDSVNDAA
jgi:hypothetical protein